MCDLLFMLVHVFNVTRTSNKDRVYTTTTERDSIVFHSFIHLMRIHGVESCFAPGVHHVRTKSQQQSKYFSKGKELQPILNYPSKSIILNLSFFIFVW